jgi:putative transcriptional regulator
MAPYISSYLTTIGLFLATGDSPVTAFVQQPKFVAITASSKSHRSFKTHLRESKDNDRARMEKSWEHMMGSDWREFRARLVAQEHADKKAAHLIEKNSKSSIGSSSKKEEKLGSFISGAISSIFNKDGKKDKEREESVSSAPATAVKEDADSSVNIFDGVDVGGATKFSKIELNSLCNDPFMDEEECHIVYDEPLVKINSHRWAHPLYHVEPGCILIANEKLGGVFHQTVVLIIDHSETTGSTGMVINR